jgi:hypothetical protein
VTDTLADRLRAVPWEGRYFEPLMDCLEVLERFDRSESEYRFRGAVSQAARQALARLHAALEKP